MSQSSDEGGDAQPPSSAGRSAASKRGKLALAPTAGIPKAQEMLTPTNTLRFDLYFIVGKVDFRSILDSQP